MTTRVTRDHLFYSFKPDLAPAVHVQPGEEVVLETHDCFQGQIQSESDLINALDWSHVNPATGPVYIEGARPGDILRVELLEVHTGEQSTMVTIPGEGALGDVITRMETAVLKEAGNTVVFKGLAIPKNPMIGVIGVAPAEGEVPNGTPGEHGGNMDCKLIGQGATLYFTVAVEGALFGAGDMHAAMGDGEIVVCGAEAPGELRFKAELVQYPYLPTPFIENDEVVATVVAAETTDQAAAEATHRMACFLTETVGMSLNDAGMLMSLVGELKFCQVVDPKKTVRFEFPKWVLEKQGFSM